MDIHVGSTATYVHATHADVDDVVDRGTIDITHDQHLFLSDTRLSVAVGLPYGLAVSLAVPFRVVSTTIRYLDTSGNVVQLVNPNIHHRNETLDGLGDPMLLGSIGRRLGDWRVTARAGATLPLGRTQPNPFVLGDQGLPHEHIQMGTGTIDPVLMLEASRAWARWHIGGYAFTQQALYHDSYGYEVGDLYAADVDVGRALGRHWSIDGGVLFQGQTADKWTQTPDPTEGNLGRIDLMLSAGASWAASKDLSLDFDVKVPVLTRAVGGQLEMPAIVGVGASWSFGARPPVREHPAANGADVADVTAPAPVAGKITIVDEWATWCAACKVLEPRLLEFARAHADTVALRRIDFTDRDDTTPLPHLIVYDASGAVLFERSANGDLPGLIDAVRAAVGETPASATVATTVHIRVTDLGFEPSNVAVPVGVPVTLIFERDSTTTCATEVVIPVDGKTIKQTLPLHQPVTIAVTFSKPGTVTYVCGMDMLHGTITVK